MSRKVFTAGEVLAAADVNSFLMDQTVMSFAGTAARGSAIPTPVEGMYTHLEDTDRLQFWNGSSWRSQEGLSLIKTVSFSGVASISLGSNADPIFSSEFDNYKVLINSRNSTDENRTWSIRLRSNTTDETSAKYNFANQGIFASGPAADSTGTLATSAVVMGNGYYTAARLTTSFEIMNPFATEITFGHGLAMGLNAAQYFHQSYSFQLDTFTSYNGFTLLNSTGNFSTGTISVYGYRKA